MLFDSSSRLEFILFDQYYPVHSISNDVLSSLINGSEIDCYMCWEENFLTVSLNSTIAVGAEKLMDPRQLVSN